MGSSKKTTVGYKYYLGAHMPFCHGPIDKLVRIRVDKKTAWIGESTGGEIYINEPKLFGGESREGGIKGYIDFEQGDTTQTVNTYLQSNQQDDIPAYRGVAAAVLKQPYLGNNPYIKPWEFRAQRIHTSTRGATQWYDAKAEIVYSIGEVFPITTSGWEYQQLPFHSDPGNTNLSIPTSGWNSGGTGPFDDDNLWDLDPDLSIFWIRRVFDIKSPGVVISAAAENGCVLFVNNKIIGASNIDNDPIPNNDRFPVEFIASSVGTYEVVVKAYTENNSLDQFRNYLSVSIDGLPTSNMNPAHIIRECLTDTTWGLGYTSADIDDVSFTVAADTLYDEEFGLSFLWSKEVEIEEFVKDVLRHIDAALYVSPSTGKFVLKLIRDDYTLGSLPVFDESNVISIQDYKKPTIGELKNYVTVKYYDILKSEMSSTTPATDPALAIQQGSISSETIQFDGVTNGELASKLAQRSLDELSNPLITCSVITNRDAHSLNIGDAFKLTWPKYGIADVVMRVTNISFGELTSGRIKIDCVQDVFGLPSASYSTPTDSNFQPVTSAPQPMQDQLVREADYWSLIQAQGEEFTLNPLDGYLVSAGGAPTGGSINYRIWSDETGSYVEKEPADFCPVATITAPLPKAESGIISTTVGISGLSQDDVDDIDIGSMCQINDELMVVEALSTTSMTVGRAVADGVIASHESGDTVYFYGVEFLGVSETLYQDGESINAKLTPSTGQGQLDVADATALPVTFDQRAYRPYPPGNLKFNDTYFPDDNGSSWPIISTWAHRDRLLQTADLNDFTESSIGPESAVTYSIDIIRTDTGDTIESATGLTGTSYTLTTDFEGEVTYTIKSVRSGLDSTYSQTHTFEISKTDLLRTEDQELIITEDGEYFATES